MNLEETFESNLQDVYKLIIKTKESQTLEEYERNLQELNKFYDSKVLYHPFFKEYEHQERLFKVDDDVLEVNTNFTWMEVCVGRLENLFHKEKERIKNSFYYFRKRNDSYSIHFCWEPNGTQQMFMVSTGVKTMKEMELCLDFLKNKFKELNLFRINI